MRKTVSITINGQLFHIEEQGYKKLDEYLDSIRSHFAGYEDKTEIVSDIEARVAEHFNEKLSTSRNVISEDDVKDLITHMGTVKDFKEFESDAPMHEETRRTFGSVTKKLYRDAENQMIAGVAAGLANYFGIDPTIMRLIFVLTLIPGGTGILIYIVLWVVLPEAKTTSEKVEMRGQPLTLKRIESVIREKVPAAAERIKPGKLSTIVQFPFMIIRKVLNTIGRILKKLFPILGRILGFFIAAVSSIGIFAFIFASIMLAVHAWEPYMDIPLRQLAGDTTYYALLTSVFFAALVPAIMIVLLGVSLILMKNMFRFTVVISLIGLWVASLMLGAVTLGKELPGFIERTEQYEETYRQESQKTLNVEDFTSIEAHGGYNVRVIKGTGSNLRVSGSKSMVEGISAIVKDGKLIITRESQNRFCIICLGNSAAVDITVTHDLQNIESYGRTDIEIDGVNVNGESITSSGGSQVSVRNAEVAQALTLKATGGSGIDVVAHNDIQELVIDGAAGSHISYSGDVVHTEAKAQAGTTVGLSGSGTSLVAEVIAGSHLDALDFTVQDATFKAAAGSYAEVHAINSLIGTADSGGSIYYIGEPAVMNVEYQPSGHVERMNRADTDFEEFE